MRLAENKPHSDTQHPIDDKIESWFANNELIGNQEREPLA